MGGLGVSPYYLLTTCAGIKTTGGFLCLKFASLYPEGFAGVIASAPLVKTGSFTSPNPAEYLALHLAPALLPNFIFTGKIELANISRDPKEVQKYKNDPLIHPWASFTLLQDLSFKSKDLLTKHASTFKLPLLVCHGTKDSLTCPKASKEFVQKSPSRDKTYQEWINFVHELHNEPQQDRQKVIATYIEWIQKRSV